MQYAGYSANRFTPFGGSAVLHDENGNITGGTIDIEMLLYDPMGAFVASTYSSSNAVIDRVLSTAGTYRLVVYDRYHNETGTYSLRWENINGPMRWCDEPAVQHHGVVYHHGQHGGEAIHLRRSGGR